MKLFKLRRGPVAEMPALNEAELVYASDTNELYIGGRTANTTPHFNGGALTDTTKGRLILRHGLHHELKDIKKGELIYIEDTQSLAIGLEANHYLILDEALKAAFALAINQKRDKDALITSQDIEPNNILLQHLSPDLIELLTGDANSVELLLAPNSVSKEMLKDDVFDFGAYQ